LEVVEEGLEEGVELALGFRLEDDAFGIKTVGTAVAGCTQLSFGSFGATGERAVGSRGSNSDSGRHTHLLAST
jgi:hypothetical protein